MWLRNFFCLYAGCWDVIASYGGVWIRQREKDWRTSPSLNSFSPIIPRTSLLNACVLKCVNGRQNPWPVVDRKRSQNLVVRARFSSTLGLEVGVSDCVTRRRRIVKPTLVSLRRISKLARDKWTPFNVVFCPQAKANKDIQNTNLQTPLHLAVERQHTQIVRVRET